MLEMAMVEVAIAMEMEMATENDPLSNHSTALSRHWLRSLKNSTCQIRMMMMNPQRKRKVPLAVPMLL
jgi:transposase